MFTGIVEELGEVVAVETGPDSARIRVRGPEVTADARHGDSIAVNGVCLTVVDVAGAEFSADVMAETLRRSSLAGVAPGSRVNLERPVRLGGRLGGHLVQGHVDGTGTVLARQAAAAWELVRISLPGELSRYVVEKGSITVDGVSLTVVEVTDLAGRSGAADPSGTSDGCEEAGAGTGSFTVSLIPTTLTLTTLGRAQPGSIVNLEVDVIAKYVERLGGWTRAGTDAATAAGAWAGTPAGTGARS